jgi:Sterol methyltransferase C-terminal
MNEETAHSFRYAADCLSVSGKEKIFTPLYITIARKPDAWHIVTENVSGRQNNGEQDRRF